MKTAVIILNYNNCEDTINCIESIERHNTAPIKYVVVDNGSTRDDAVAKLEEYFQGKAFESCTLSDDGQALSERGRGLSGGVQALSGKGRGSSAVLPYLTFLISAVNDGYARGNNKGIMLACGDEEVDKILVLNNDILFVEDIIPRLSMEMERLPDCAIISPVLYRRNLTDIDYNCARRNASVGGLIRENILHYWHRLSQKKESGRKRMDYILPTLTEPYPRILPIELPSGACMLVSKKTFHEIGFFDPNTFLYFEENILYKKVSGMGLKNYLHTQCRCVHLGASSAASVPSLFLINCNIDSGRYYVRKYSGCSLFLVFLFYLSTVFFRASFRLQKAVMRKTCSTTH